MMKKVWGIFIAVLLVVVLAFVGCSNTAGSVPDNENNSEREELTNIRIGYVAMALSSPQAMMEEETGLFAELLGELGITVEWVQSRGRDGTGELMDNLEVDFIYIPANNTTVYITETNQFGGSDNFRVIAGAAQTKDNNVVIGGPGVESLADLDGKTVGIVNHSYVEEFMLNTQLEAIGLKTEFIGGTVKVEHTDWMHLFLESFESGEYEAIAARSSNIDSVLERVNGSKVIVSLNEGNVFEDFAPKILLLARKDYIDNYPDVVKAVLRAHVRATQEAQDAGAEILGQVSMDSYNHYFENVLKAKDYPTYPLEHYVRTYKNAEVTYDPHVSFFVDVHAYMTAAGHLNKTIDHLLSIGLLNEVLAEERLAKVPE
jgi:NitT/TauT family transport system substrate-binding protein